ncbi:carbohydrate-binding module family 50 protein [Xylaria arbuscula]|nr:carbohydrate-binding module family 50 protein [Xylaria arbuscula]
MLSHLIASLLIIAPALGYLVDPPTTAPDDTVQDCTNWVEATSSDTCESIAAANFLALSDLYTYNPSLSASSCPLIVGDSYCIEENFGVPPPPPTSTRNGISTPTPIQTGIASNCNKFYEVQSGDICDTIVAAYGIPLSNFYAWNPAVGSSCTTLIPGDYVCVGIIASSVTTTTTTTKATTTSGNGVSTPTPVQTGIATNCNRFYLVQSGDVCDTIVAQYGIALTNFYAWNPAVGSSCTKLIPGDYVCVGVIGSVATTTTTTSTTTKAPTGNGIATPTPIQTGMVSDCDEFYLVKTGDTCDAIASAKGISVANFYAWNPAAGLNTCKTLQAQTYACVGVQSCTTNTYGLVIPQPAGASCGIAAVSNGGTTLVSYSSGTPVASLLGCKNACLATVGCTNIYYTEGKACNLHAGAGTHVASSTSAFQYYDSSCFVCPSKCPSGSSPPASAICNVKAVSNGGTAIISYSSGAPIQNIQNCGATCLATTGCTNLYFQPGTYCNLKAGAETHVSSSTSSYAFYEASCFQCATPSCWTDAQGLAIPQPSSAVCKVAAYSNGGTIIISYSSGDPIMSIKACSSACLATSGCTNLYYQAGKYCNLHSGADTHNSDSTSPYLFYTANCFEC